MEMGVEVLLKVIKGLLQFLDVEAVEPFDRTRVEIIARRKARAVIPSMLMVHEHDELAVFVCGARNACKASLEFSYKLVFIALSNVCMGKFNSARIHDVTIECAGAITEAAGVDIEGTMALDMCIDGAYDVIENDTAYCVDEIALFDFAVDLGGAIFNDESDLCVGTWSIKHADFICRFDDIKLVVRVDHADQLGRQLIHVGCNRIHLHSPYKLTAGIRRERDVGIACLGTSTA